MRKLFIFTLMVCLLITSVASAGTKLKGKGLYEADKQIGFVPGTGEVVQILGEKLKIASAVPITGYGTGYGLKPADPNSHMYYFRTPGITRFNYAFGVKGLALRVENLTDNVLVVHWNESVIQIGNSSGMPFINGMKYIDAGKPADTPNTIIPPKSFINVDVYPATNVRYDSGSWGITFEPISDEGITQVAITMKVEEDGASKYYSYKTPCLDFPATFVAEHKDTKQ